MPSEAEKRRIFEKSDGRCHICYRPLDFHLYGKADQPGGWEIDHSRPRAAGGTNHINNLFAACCSCNRSKQDRSSYEVRQAHGRRRPPLSSEKVRKARADNAVKYGALGLIAGAIIPGAQLGPAVIGALLGLLKDPND